MKTSLPSHHLMIPYEVTLHYKRPLFSSMRHIFNAEEAVTVLRSHIHPNQLDLREHFWVILLSNSNNVLGVSEVASGTTKGVQTNPKYIFQLALLTNASSIIIAHNHPSGNLNISDRDIKETKKIKRLAITMDITLLDHIIITSESFVSFTNKGEL